MSVPELILYYAKVQNYAGIKRFFLSYYGLNGSLDRLKIDEGDESGRKTEKERVSL